MIGRAVPRSVCDGAYAPWRLRPLPPPRIRRTGTTAGPSSVGNGTASPYPFRRGLVAWTLLVLLAAWAAAPASSAAQPADVDVTLQARIDGRIHPGQVLTTTARVANTGSGTIRVTPTTVLPPGWTLVIADAPFTVAADAVDTRLLSIRVPRLAEAGRYAISYRATTDAGAVVEDSIEVDVASVRRITLARAGTPSFAAAGEPYVATFSLTNEGNEEVAVDVSVTSTPSFPVQMDDRRHVLAPRETAVIRLVVRPPSAIETEVDHRVQLVASTAGASSLSTTAFARVRVVPRRSRIRPPVRRLPLLTSLRLVGQGNTVSPQVEVAGEGALVEGADDLFQVLVRTPRAQQPGIFGQRDTYRFNYRFGPHLVRLGDNAFRLSQLTTSNSYGFGAGVDAKHDALSWGGFVQRERYFANPERQIAAYAGYRFSDRARVRLNALQKTGGYEPGSMLAMQGVFGPWPGAELYAEYGLGGTSPRRDGGAYVELRGRHPRLSYLARYLYGGTSFPGYRSNTDDRSVSAAYRFNGAFTVEGSASHTTQRLFRNPRFNAGLRRSLNARVGLRYRSQISGFFRRRAAREAGALLFDERSIQLRFAPYVGRTSVYSSAEAGLTSGRSFTSEPFYRVTLGGGTTLSSGRSIRAGFEYYDGMTPYQGIPERRLSGNLSLSTRLVGRTSLDLRLYGSMIQGVGERLFGSGDVSIVHVFPSLQRLVLRTRGSTSNALFGRNDVDFSIAYVLPIGVPIGRVTSIGQIQGRLFTAATGEGIANTLVSLGDAAVITDDGGGFAFANLAPGAHQLQIDPSGLAAGFVPVFPMPMQVEVQAGRTRSVEVPVVRAGALAGRVVRYRFEDASATTASRDTPLVPAGGVGGVLVEARREAVIQRRMTGPDGGFSFEGLRPGTWRLRIAGGQLPPDHDVARDTLIARVASGQSDSVQMNLLPRRRRVRMVEGGTVRQGGVLTARPAQEGHVLTPRRAPADRRSPVARSEDPARQRQADARTPRGAEGVQQDETDAGVLRPRPMTAARRRAAPPDVRRDPPGVLRPQPMEEATSPSDEPDPVAATERSEPKRGAAPSQQEPPARTYTVSQDDVSLMDIARRVYGDGFLWPKIWLANRDALPDPDVIEPGQMLRIPPETPLTPDEQVAYTRYRRGGAPPAPPARRTYVVTPDDISLMDIARRVYGDGFLWPKIWLANRDALPDPDVIEPGQQLDVPPRAPLTVDERAALQAYLAR